MQIQGLIYDATFGHTIELAEPIKLIQPTPELLCISDKALELIKHFESLHDGDKSKPNLQPMMDPIGIWTVGWGRALRDKSGKFIKGIGNKSKAYAHELANLTIEQADELLKEDIYSTYLPATLKMVKRRNFLPFQIGALTSFTYNCGTHYRGANGSNIPFKLWSLIDTYPDNKTLYNYWKGSVIKSGGKVLQGLVRRRRSEAFLYLFDKVNFYPPDVLIN